MATNESSVIYKFNKKLPIKILAFVLALTISMVGAFSSYAMNFDFLNPSKWDNEENITTVQLRKSSTVNSLNGVLKYFLDERESCLYVAFFINENTLSVERDDFRALYTITSLDVNNSFSVSKDGIAENDEDIDFSVYQNYSTYDDYRYKGEYITVVDFGKVKYDTKVDISIYINGHIYYGIAEINVPPTKTTTSKSAKTTTTKQSKDKTTAKNKTAKTTTNRSTKFSPSGTVARTTSQSNTKYSYTTSNGVGTQKEEVATVSYRDEQAVEQQSEGYSPKGKLTDDTKRFLIVAGIIAFIGICFLIASAFMKPDEKKENEENEIKSEKEEKE